MTDATPVIDRTGAPSAKPAGPIIFFDFARGISAQAVVLGHALNIFVPGIFMVPGQRVFYMQSFAVIIFFVLSGFLITSALLKKKSQPSFTFGSYLIDRIARVVYPLLPAVLLITVFDFLFFHGSTKLPFIRVILNPQTIAGNFLLLFNHPILAELAPRLHMPWLSVDPVGSAAPLWSVVAEWWIYVAFGLLAFIAIRRLKPGVGSIALLVFAIAVPLGYMAKGGYESLAWIIGMLYALAATHLRKLPGVFHALIALTATAGFLAALYYGDQNLHAASCIGTASVAFCHLYFWQSGRKKPVTAQAADAVVPAEASAAAQPGWRWAGSQWFNRLSVFLSSFSYSLYLIHFSVITYLWSVLHTHLSAWQLIPLALVVSNVLAYGYFLLVERHFHKVGKFLKARILR